MKKIFLTAAVAVGTFVAANAGGFCRVGTAQLTHIEGDKWLLECPGDGVCYETDDQGNTSPGSKITIHFGTARIEAVIMSGGTSGGNLDPSDKDKPTDKLPATLVVTQP